MCRAGWSSRRPSAPPPPRSRTRSGRRRAPPRSARGARTAAAAAAGAGGGRTSAGRARRYGGSRGAWPWPGSRRSGPATRRWWQGRLNDIARARLRDRGEPVWGSWPPRTLDRVNASVEDGLLPAAREGVAHDAFLRELPSRRNSHDRRLAAMPWLNGSYGAAGGGPSRRQRRVRGDSTRAFVGEGAKDHSIRDSERGGGLRSAPPSPTSIGETGREPT